MKTKYVSRESLFRTPDDAKAPGLFHVIEPDASIGWRTGLIIERGDGITYAINLLLSIKGLKKKEFIFDFGTQTTFDWPVYWLRCSWRLPASLGFAAGISPMDRL